MRETGRPPRAIDVDDHRRGQLHRATCSASGVGLDRAGSNDAWPHGDEALGGLRAHLLALLRVVAGLGAAAASVLDLVLGRLDDDGARRCRNPARPARPAIWWNSRALELPHLRCRRTSTSAVNSTVRIGTLMPTPRVSVPQIDAAAGRAGRAARPGGGTCGSIPAWCTPMPCAHAAATACVPNAVEKRKPPISLGDRRLLLRGAHVHARAGPAPAPPRRPGRSARRRPAPARCSEQVGSIVSCTAVRGVARSAAAPAARRR